MNDRYRRVYEVAVRTSAFINAYLTSFGGLPLVAELKTELATAIAALNALGADKVTKTGAAKDMTIHRGDARDALLDAMQDITNAWRHIFPKIGDDPNKFRMARGGDQNILAAAQSYADQAAPLKTEFVKRGFDPNFVEVLTDSIDAFSQNINQADTARRERVGTNAAFDAPVKTCKNVIEDLDSIVKMKFRDNPQILAEWLVASHIERPARRNNGAAAKKPPANS